MKVDKIHLLLSAAIIALVIVLAMRERPRMAKQKQRPEPQTAGEYWLAMSEDAKLAYVSGFQDALIQGEEAGCYFYEEKITPYLPRTSTQDILPSTDCFRHMPQLTKYTKEYADAVTEYFHKYPHDSRMGATLVLLDLATPPGLTVDQIHAKLTQQ